MVLSEVGTEMSLHVLAYNLKRDSQIAPPTSSGADARISDLLPICHNVES